MVGNHFGVKIIDFNGTSRRGIVQNGRSMNEFQLERYLRKVERLSTFTEKMTPQRRSQNDVDSIFARGDRCGGQAEVGRGQP